MTTTQGYISLPITLSPTRLVQAAIAAIQAKIPGWVPNEGQLDVAILEEAALMMSVAAATATSVPISIFSRFGTLVGVTPIKGAPATAPVTFTMTDDAGYTIPAGLVLAYPLSGNQQLLFTLESAVVIPTGTTTGIGTIVCETPGTFANDLTEATLQLVTTFAQIASVATTAVTGGGVAPDTISSYINRLSSELQLMAPRPILPSDFAGMARNVPGVYRALAIDGLNPGRSVTGAHTTTGSDTVSASSGAFSTLDVGRTVTGSGIPGSTTIASVTNATTIVLSHDATATATDVTLTLDDLTTQERFVTVCGVTQDGTPLSSTVTATLKAYLDAKREVNFVVATIQPTYTEIDVTVTVDVATGNTPTAVQTSVADALAAFLSPATWGGGASQVPQWSATANEVRFLDIAQTIHNVSGVLYIPSSTLTIALHGDDQGTSDLTLPGDAPLPKSGTIVVHAS